VRYLRIKQPNIADQVEATGRTWKAYEVYMQMMRYLDIDPTVLADLLRALTVQGEVLAIRAGQEALAIGSVAGMAAEATIRTHLTARGLTPRQCDLVVLDLPGRSRAALAQLCGVSAATVKKY
jgi:hypothetical protein